VWNGIFQNFRKRRKPREVYPNFQKFLTGIMHALCSRSFRNFRPKVFERFAFWKYNNSQIFQKTFSGNFTQFSSVSKVSEILVEWKAFTINLMFRLHEELTAITTPTADRKALGVSICLEFKMESVPKELRNLRACLLCSLVKVGNFS